MSLFGEVQPLKMAFKMGKWLPNWDEPPRSPGFANMFMFLFGEFKHHLQGLQNDENPPVFMMFKEDIHPQSFN